MRKLIGLFVVLILGCTMVVAQANPSHASGTKAQSAQGTAQTPITAPRTSRGDRTASEVNRGTQDETSATAGQAQPADQNGQPAANSPQPSNTQRASNTGNGVPWGWIIVGVIVIAIILALIGRGGSDRVVTTREREIERDRTLGPTPVDDRRDDDIRRAG